MRLAKCTLAVLMLVLMLSIFVANVANLIDVDSHLFGDDHHSDDDVVTTRWSKPKKYDIDDSPDHLIWFLQITDLHLSIFRDATRVPEFREFCDITVGSIKPEVVLASGDLTDAKTSDRVGSRQFVEEWLLYKKTLDDSRVTEKTTWLDVRGNHDNFNVLDYKSKENYFANYSVQGRQHSRSYMYDIQKGTDKYSFIAIDACLMPGPKRPFNFVGLLDEREIAKIHRLAAKSREDDADFMVWFGHYPTSCIVSPNDGGVKSIIGKYEESMTYLCGHFHTLGGIVPNMYSLQRPGFLELELADWKDNRISLDNDNCLIYFATYTIAQPEHYVRRTCIVSLEKEKIMYRLGVIDHGQFSFVDVEHRDWPVALVTNPKNARFSMPRKENLQSIIDSTHIRVLAFSVASIKSVKVRINHEDWTDCKNIKGPLYVVKWNSSNYKTGLHDIQVEVIDTEGREKTITQAFSLDGSRLAFGVLPRIILMSDVSHIFQISFIILFLILVLPLVILRIYHDNLCHIVNSRSITPPRSRIGFIRWWVRSHWILSTVDRLFFPLVTYAVYLFVGPWIIGEIIDNHTGVVFAWGTYVGNSFLPGSFTYAYGFFQLLTFHCPLTLLVAHGISRRLRQLENPHKKTTKILSKFWEQLPFLLLISMQTIMIYLFWLAYGTVATVLCPLRTWSLFMALYLWYQVYEMPPKCLRSAAKVWCTDGHLVSDDKAETERNAHNDRK